MKPTLVANSALSEAFVDSISDLETTWYMVYTMSQPDAIQKTLGRTMYTSGSDRTSGSSMNVLRVARSGSMLIRGVCTEEQAWW